VNLDAEQKIGSRTAWFSIFTSASTLICCALPALLVALGAGATLVTLIGAVPQLVWISEHKVGVFTVAGGMLFVAGYFQYRARRLPCPVDAALAAACGRQRKVALAVYIASVAIFVLGAFFAFIAPYVLL
jgi:hypothetical protein